MTSERVQRQIERLLDEADQAASSRDWAVVKERSEHVLTFDPENRDARALLAAAQRGLGNSEPLPTGTPTPSATVAPAPPTSFANGRYEVKRFLGEGGKKKVYLAHDSLLDRDVAFALIKTEGLDAVGRQRITREAQAMGRLGDHPNIVSVYDLGEHEGQPYMVLPLLPGGDVEGVIEKAPEHRLPLDRLLRIAIETCQGLEFAHGKGIVHRDLKPGNVWLAADGRAQIGDFGLAVAVDKSRLTQAGMMVGTVSYMPPEQAMGGEVTPRSDLYSLGAMLYEMVCGRPPFVGDESVAIIGQHLNTPPVAPSWHRPDCPPALETLILRLLEKDPLKRPASAAEVHGALESIAQASRRADSQAGLASENLSTVNDPLYRRTFIGRELELKQLEQAFDATLSGRGSIAMVVGEPGIGKTSTCEQLATYVGLRGGQALVGHCYEEGSLSLPYLPFVEAMRSYVLGREPDGLKSDLGSGATEVARMVSEVRDKLQVSPADGGDPEEQRWRLFQAVVGFLHNASQVRPLLIVLEDLHDADRGTLDLLLHIARSLQGSSRGSASSRLMLVGTYRDVEVDRNHPLSAALAELRRMGNFLRVPLRGLSIDEVHRMYSSIRGQEVAWGQAELVHRQTEGNPLFVQEVLRYLVEEGLVKREAGRYVLSEGVTAGSGIPEGLRDVVGRRLSHLSENTNQVLSVAAVMGRDFRLDVLQQLVGLPENELEASLEEARERAIIEEHTGLGAAVGYRFAHAFFRQALYEEIIAPRRIRLHQQVALGLETVYGRRLEEHAAELAEHFSHSSNPADLAKAVAYGELSARRAMSVFDYGEAVRHLQQALQVQDVLDADDKLKRCDLLLALGEAMMTAAEPLKAAREVAPHALSLAESLHDPTRAARASVTALLALRRYGATSILGTAEYREWADRANRYAAPETSERVHADLSVAGYLRNDHDFDRAHALILRAMELAGRIGDQDAFFYAGYQLMLPLWPSKYDKPSYELTLESLSWPRAGASARSTGLVLFHGASVLLCWGDRDGAEKLWLEQAEISKRTRDPNVAWRSLSAVGMLALADGRWDDAAAAGAELWASGSILGRQWGAELRLCACLLLGSSLDAEDVAQMGRGNIVSPSLFLLDRADVSAAAQRLAKALSTPDDPLSDQPVGFLVGLLDIAVFIADREAVATLAALLEHDDRAPVIALYQPRTVDRSLGGAFAFLGDAAKARHHFVRAIDLARQMRLRPELALTRLELAEFLLHDYPDERADAIQLLDFAIAEFRDLKMQPSLERALGHRELLKA